jgi:hypothetical protein
MMKKKITISIFLLIFFGFACNPETIQPNFQRDYGTLIMVPNPSAVPEDRIEFRSPGFREITGVDTLYYRTTRTKTNTQTATNVDTTFTARIPNANVKAFIPD